MNNTNLTSRFRSLNQVVIALFLFASPLAGAYAACCAGHGGVASCNKSTGHQMCKDGTASPTCTCAIPKTTKKTTTKKVTTTPATATTPATTKTTKKTTKTTTPATTTTTKPKSSWWGGKSTTTTTAPATTKGTSGTSAKGCCSRHGGVAQCNKSSGHQMCKDGTASPTCTCQ
jgi:hypothetical protein